MTTEEFLVELNRIVSLDDRWLLKNLSFESKGDSARREICRWADNLIYSESSGHEYRANLMRSELNRSILELKRRG